MSNSTHQGEISKQTKLGNN